MTLRLFVAALPHLVLRFAARAWPVAPDTPTPPQTRTAGCESREHIDGPTRAVAGHVAGSSAYTVAHVQAHSPVHVYDRMDDLLGASGFLQYV